MNDSGCHDLIVIGGGINGGGIACDAAGRGLKVVLLEAGDLAGGTSSSSSKLIHGGLRYLEHMEFRLVREALQEREVMLAKAPHLVSPLRFVLPHVSGMRSQLTLRAGLFLYDHLARRQQMPASRAIDLAEDPSGKPLKAEFRNGFEYWDCWVDDARLVIANARAAANFGAVVRTRTRALSAEVRDGVWIVKVQDPERRVRELACRVLVNAAGPWVGEVAKTIHLKSGDSDHTKVRLIKGSHIVLPRIAGANSAYLFQHSDGRVVFALPFEREFTLIGTTDIAFEGDPVGISISRLETDYLLKLANTFFRVPLRQADIRWSFSGVRPLYDDAAADPAAVTRDYHLELDAPSGLPPLLTVLGGKVTTYRRLAEEGVNRLEPYFPTMRSAWTRQATLPGGELDGATFAEFVEMAKANWAAIDGALIDQLVKRHGSRISAVLGDAKTMADLGEEIGGGLFAREVAYFKGEEWAAAPEDVLWRRSKAGLHMSAEQRSIAERRLESQL